MKALAYILLFLALAGGGWWAMNRELEFHSDLTAERERLAPLSPGPPDRRPELLMGALGYAVSTNADQSVYQLKVTEFDAGGAPAEELMARHPGAARAFPHWPKQEMGVGTGRITQIELLWKLPQPAGKESYVVRMRDAQTGTVLDRANQGWVREGHLYAALHPPAIHPFRGRITVRALSSGDEWDHELSFPGLPVVNEGLVDAFDARVPCLVLRDPLDALRFVAGTAQLEIEPEVEINPYSFRTVGYVDVTLREVLADLLVYDEDGRIRVDRRSHRIVRLSTPWEQMRGWLAPLLP